MTRPVCMFTGQWADLSLEVLARKLKGHGYDGLELAVWGDHFDVSRVLNEDSYVEKHWKLLSDAGLGAYAVSTHLVGQATCDPIDIRHRAILSPEIWGDGDPKGVRERAVEEVKNTARAARKFFDAAPTPVRERLDKCERVVVNGFTGSPVWHLLYGFPPPVEGQIDAGYAEFAEVWNPILDVFESEGVYFALEAHPTEVAFDIETAKRTLDAIDHHPHFGFNFDPSHFAYQSVDYLQFLREFGDLIFNVHVKDVWWSERPTPIGVFGGHSNFGDDGRSWDFRSPGHGRVDFEGIIRLLNHAKYEGPLTVEWEDPMMSRDHGAAESAEFVRKLDFPGSDVAFDAAFAE